MQPFDRRARDCFVEVHPIVCARAYAMEERVIKRRVFRVLWAHGHLMPQRSCRPPTKVRTGFSDTGRKHVATMPRHGHLITAFLQIAQQIRLVRLHQMRQRAMTSGVRVPPGHQVHPRRTAHRMIGISLTKAHAALRQRIDVRRVCQRIAKAAQRIGAQLVRHENKQIRARCRISHPTRHHRDARARRASTRSSRQRRQ